MKTKTKPLIDVCDRKRNHKKKQNCVYKTVSMYCEYLAELQTICREYWNRICGLEGDKYDLERGSALKKMEVKRLNTAIKLKTN